MGPKLSGILLTIVRRFLTLVKLDKISPPKSCSPNLHGLPLSSLYGRAYHKIYTTRLIVVSNPQSLSAGSFASPVWSHISISSWCESKIQRVPSQIGRWAVSSLEYYTAAVADRNWLLIVFFSRVPYSRYCRAQNFRQATSSRMLHDHATMLETQSLASGSSSGWNWLGWECYVNVLDLKDEFSRSVARSLFSFPFLTLVFLLVIWNQLAYQKSREISTECRVVGGRDTK